MWADDAPCTHYLDNSVAIQTCRSLYRKLEPVNVMSHSSIPVKSESVMTIVQCRQEQALWRFCLIYPSVLDFTDIPRILINLFLQKFVDLILIEYQINDQNKLSVDKTFVLVQTSAVARY